MKTTYFLESKQQLNRIKKREGKFVPLHNGTVLIVNVCCLFALTKIQSNYYRTNFFRQLSSQQFLLCLYFRNFAPQPDEETGSAEEQPASNMAAPTLKAVDEEPSYPRAAHCIQTGSSAKKTFPPQAEHPTIRLCFAV